MLYIMRHGRTAWNAAHRLQGKTDVPLSEEGRETAAEAGERYRDTHFDVCFCSPLIRARETAALLLWGRDVPIMEDARLEEMGFGVCEGTSDFDKNPESPIYPLFHAPETYGTPAEGGESLAALFERSGGTAAAAGEGRADRRPWRHERQHHLPDPEHSPEGFLECQNEKRGTAAADLSMAALPEWTKRRKNVPV